MNVLSQSGTSDYQNRTVTINVTGVCQQSVLKDGGYQVKVPYSQMSQAMQTIHHQGGQVASVQVGNNPPARIDRAAKDDGENAESAADEGDRKKSAKRKRR